MQTGTTKRQAAILGDMGVDVWVPRDAADPEAAGHLDSAIDSDLEGSWPRLQSEVEACQRCDLAATRTQTVFGIGDPHADLMFIGEAPGAEEDRRGEPFVGRAGKLLDAMLFSIGLTRQSIFICNVLKCRPPNNNDPQSAQIEACSSYLDAQIAYVQPKLIVALGRFAAHRLLKTDAPVWRMRESDNLLPDSDIPLVVTYHPASLLRNPDNKARVWQDLCKVRKLLS
ncbi:MAG TPA: hypothetical protein DDW55_14285 [Gammaproteobacteria bacterium]|nr:hypothetical protein [Gammaproteobacteria bacterium]